MSPINGPRRDETDNVLRCENVVLEGMFNDD